MSFLNDKRFKTLLPIDEMDSGTLDQIKVTI